MSLLSIYKSNRKLISSLLFVLGLIFLLLLVKQSWTEIKNTLSSIRTFEFTLAVAIGILSNFVMAIYFNRLLKKYDVLISDRFAIKLFMVGQIAKYIPGKIWSFAYQISQIEKLGGAAGVILANFELIIGAIYLITLIALVIFSLLMSKLLAFILCILGLLVFIIIYKNNIIKKILNLIGNLYKNKIQTIKINKSSTSILSGFFIFSLFCTFYVLSSYYMLRSAFDFTLQETLLYVAILSTSWVGGIIIFIVPLGVGVREYLFVITASYFTSSVPMEVMLSIAVLSRITQIIQELIGATIALIIKK